MQVSHSTHRDDWVCCQTSALPLPPPAEGRGPSLCSALTTRWSSSVYVTSINTASSPLNFIVCTGATLQLAPTLGECISAPSPAPRWPCTSGSPAGCTQTYNSLFLGRFRWFRGWGYNSVSNTNLTRLRIASLPPTLCCHRILCPYIIALSKRV